MIRGLFLGLVLILPLSTAIVEGGGQQVDSEVLRKRLVADLISKQTRLSGLLVVRDDEVRFPLCDDAYAQTLILYRARDGGYYTDVSGRSIQVVVDDPEEWTVFLDPADNRIFRMSGFESGNDFNSLARSFQNEVDVNLAGGLARGYAELAHGPRTRVLRDSYQVRRLANNALYDAGLEMQAIDARVHPWLLEHEGRLGVEFQKDLVLADARGFSARLVVGQITRRGRFPRVEIRRLVLRITSRSEVLVDSEEHIATLDMNDPPATAVEPSARPDR